jgi:hypothetical protein
LRESNKIKFLKQIRGRGRAVAEAEADQGRRQIKIRAEAEADQGGGCVPNSRHFDKNPDPVRQFHTSD